jgi:hypothetical protein
MFTSFVRRSATNGCVGTPAATMRSKMMMAFSKTTTAAMIRPVMNYTVPLLDVPQQRRSFSDDTATATFDLSGAFEVCISS